MQISWHSLISMVQLFFHVFLSNLMLEFSRGERLVLKLQFRGPTTEISSLEVSLQVEW